MPSLSELEIKIQELEEQNQLLKCENEQLKVERVVTVIQQKEILPKGYDTDMKRLKLLERELKKVRKLLEYGNISTLESLISEYQAMSKIRLEKIVYEYQFYYTNHEERLLVQDFIEYLHSVESELKKFLFMDDEESEESGEVK